MMRVVYIAGPFRAKPNPFDHWAQWQNVLRAGALGLDVWKLGAVAMTPHLNTAFFQGAAADDVWLRGDLELLARCDAVLMTPDWQASVGATAEHDHAKAKGLPIFYNLETLARWLNDNAARELGLSQTQATIR